MYEGPLRIPGRDDVHAKLAGKIGQPALTEDEVNVDDVHGGLGGGLESMTGLASDFIVD